MDGPPTPSPLAGPAGSLSRVIGVPGAVMMGLGSILGTGVFVSIGIAAQITGPSVIFAVALAALVATLNGLSSAQLAANHPVSGGTYEYGYRYLNPSLGFAAGWLFLCAKSASAATAALGFSGYLLHALGISAHAPYVALAVGAIALLTALIAGGTSRSNRANSMIVGLTLTTLLAFVAVGLPRAVAQFEGGLAGLFDTQQQGPGSAAFLQATALMFVAYTGYGRIATLGEEVHEPKKSIPRAIIVTLLCSMALYCAVAFVAVFGAGASGLVGSASQAAAPLEHVARGFGVPGISWLVAAGAVTAMLGVLLNLILGLSRVVLAMARRGDMPAVFSRVDQERSSPRAAVLLVGVLIASLALLADVRTTWSFSAFTVLVYYALTNLAALRLKEDERLYPRIIPALGLLSCLSLAFWVEAKIWIVGLLVMVVGQICRRLARRRVPT